ncbi:hypothetical protein TRVA0_025S01222 [Trichomonascus vanleenenianus]|uniref:uncharacterized protein n=1 Tax=Trichomonascus vanleenenianus TaxID=2268995 RepID=UPI003ECA1682
MVSVLLRQGLKVGKPGRALWREFSSQGNHADGSVLIFKGNEGPFNVQDEYGLLRVLFSKRFEDPKERVPYVEQVKRIRRVHEYRSSRKTSGSLEDLARMGDILAQKTRSSAAKNDKAVAARQQMEAELVPKIKTILATVSSPTDLDSFLKINSSYVEAPGRILSDLDSSLMRWAVTALSLIVRESNSHTLPLVADLLMSYWGNGFQGIAFTRSDARRLVAEVLERAMELYAPTQYEVRNNEISVHHSLEEPDLFRYLVESFLDTYELPYDSEVSDLLLQLVAQSGPIEAAEAILADYLRNAFEPSPLAVDLFIQALANEINAQRLVFSGSDAEFIQRVKSELNAHASVLVSDHVTPAVVEFLLSWTTSYDEVYAVLETASLSKHAEDVYTKCQVPILSAIVRCSSNDAGSSPYATAMAHMFGVLNRFRELSPQGITSEAYDQCLLLSAMYGNSQGMYRAIAMKMSLEDKSKHVIPRHIAAEVLDRLPTADSEVAREKKTVGSWWLANNLANEEYSLDQAVLFHLRTMIDSKSDIHAYQRYIAALGRLALTDRLASEWTKLVEHGLTVETPQDVVLEFISAYKTAERSDRGLQLLGQVLDMTTEATHNGYAVSVLRKVFRYEILPLRDTVLYVARWFIRNKDKAQWTGADIEATFDEMGSRDSLTSFTSSEARAAGLVGRAIAEAILQVQRGNDVDEALNSLNEMLARSI